MSATSLTQILERSSELEAAIWSALPDPYRLAMPSPRHDASLAAAMMAVEEGQACRLLISQGMHTTGIAVTRMQFEAICRSMWLLYAATDDEIGKATATLTAEGAKEANDLPMVSKMIEALPGKAPPLAIQMLGNFKEANLKALHQFVHAGFQPLKRTLDGYSEELVVGILRNCNGLSLTTGAMLAVLAGSQLAMGAIARLQVQFADSLPSSAPAGPASGP
ncbi:MAG: hypothetical protein V4639_04560 [Pseudomonadota bacterium]